MFSKIEDAIADIKQGKMVIVVDDENRENEGDFIMAGDHITSEAINFMAMNGRGLICTPVSAKLAKNLNLYPMVEDNEDSMNTAFTVSIDASANISTGISASDRAYTVKLLTQDSTKPSDFNRPGHIFPLIAKDNGVIQRQGHTEAAIDLARLANCSDVGVICEILNSDGTCARVPDLIKVSRKFNLKLITIKDLFEYINQKNNKGVNHA